MCRIFYKKQNKYFLNTYNPEISKHIDTTTIGYGEGQFVNLPLNEKMERYDLIQQIFLLKNPENIKKKYHLFVEKLLFIRKMLLISIGIEENAAIPEIDLDDSVNIPENILDIIKNDKNTELHFLLNYDKLTLLLFIKYHLHPICFNIYKAIINKYLKDIMSEEDFIGIYNVGLYNPSFIDLNKYIHGKSINLPKNALFIGERLKDISSENTPTHPIFYTV